MLQSDIDREIAIATGESVQRIARSGFSLVPKPAPLKTSLVRCRRPSRIAWDSLQELQRASFLD